MDRVSTDVACGQQTPPLELDFLKNFACLAPRSPATPVVLVLGGSCFMGRELVQLLLAENIRVCVVNRGRAYWGTTDHFDGRTARVVTDRHGDAHEFAQRIAEATYRLGTSWDLVADFSAFNGEHIRASLEGLRGRFRFYVYVSSDSIYEVSAWAANGWHPRSVKGNCVDEAVGQRPPDDAEQQRLCYADRYGHEKRCAEESLALGLSESAPQSQGLILRLPDVLGPFDRTLRLFAYWHWLRLSTEEAIQVPRVPATQEDADTGASVPLDPLLACVYSRDVAMMIAGLVKSDPPAGVPRCDAINLACSEQLRLSDILCLLAEAADLPPPSLISVPHPFAFLPSVKRPWPLCCQRATDVYGFVPTPLAAVLKACVAWFEEALVAFPEQSQRAAGKLPHQARQTALMLARLQEQSAAS